MRRLPASSKSAGSRRFFRDAVDGRSEAFGRCNLASGAPAADSVGTLGRFRRNRDRPAALPVRCGGTPPGGAVSQSALRARSSAAGQCSLRIRKPGRIDPETVQKRGRRGTAFRPGRSGPKRTCRRAVSFSCTPPVSSRRSS